MKPYIPRYPPFTYGGTDNPQFDEAAIVIIPVPFDSTASYRSGSRDGPDSIIDASRYMELFDHETGWSPCSAGIHTMAGVEPCRGSVEETLGRVKEAVREVFEARKFPVLLGGEHSLAIGAVSAAAGIWKDLHVVSLDAHCDLRDEYEGSKHSHACTMRRVLEHAQKVTGFGMRSCSEEEWDLLREKDHGFHFWVEGDREASMRSLEAAADEVSRTRSPVYLSIDLDVFNPAELPAVGTPEPSGPSFDDLLPLIRTIAGKRNLVGMDMVELTPIAGDNRSEFLAARLLYKVIAYHFKPGKAR